MSLMRQVTHVCVKTHNLHTAGGRTYIEGFEYTAKSAQFVGGDPHVGLVI